jgi:hypothetical protein
VEGFVMAAPCGHAPEFREDSATQHAAAGEKLQVLPHGLHRHCRCPFKAQYRLVFPQIGRPQPFKTMDATWGTAGTH